MEAPVILYGRLGCPWAARVALVALEKRVAHRWLRPGDPAFPEGLTPVLVHGEVRLAESYVIAEYLDERFDGPPLSPSDAGERAEHRLLRLRFSLARVEADVVALFAEVERLLVGDWLGGDAPSLADFDVWVALGLAERAGRIPQALQTYRDRAWARASVRTTGLAT